MSGAFEESELRKLVPLTAMQDDRSRHNQNVHVRQALESLEKPGDQHFWDVFDELSFLPPSYDVTVEQFRAGLYSPNHFIQTVSATNVARFARDADWALPELEGLLKREPHDVLLVSATAAAIQSIGTTEAAAVLAGALQRLLASDLPSHQKGELSTYILRSLVSMGLVAHEQRGAFRRAVEYFTAQENMAWAPECLRELDMFCVETAKDLNQLVLRDPTTPLTDEVLIGYRVRSMPSVQERTYGTWAVLMDEYCKFSSCGLPDRFAFLEDACYAEDRKGRNLGLARVVVLENDNGIMAVCLSCDEAGVGPVSWYPEVATGMLHRTMRLDPSSTFVLTYHLSAAGNGVHGELVLRESPSLRIASPNDLFQDAFGDIQQMLFEGTALPKRAVLAAQHLKRER